MAGFTVPTKQRQVAPTALPSARQISPAGQGDFGGFEADVIGRIGGQVERLGRTALAVEEKERVLAAKAEAKKLKIQAKFKEERDKLFAQDAVIKYQDWWRNQEPTYTSKTGLAADGVTDIAIKDIEGFNKTLLAKLENDNQREKALAKIMSERNSGLTGIKGHEVSEFKLLKEKQNEGIIANSINIAAASVGKLHEEGTIFSKSLDLKDAITEKTKGFSMEAAKNVSDEIWSSFHESILNRKVALNAVDAKEYYDKNKKQILPDKRDAIEKLLKKEGIIQYSQQRADEIVLTEPDSSKWAEIGRKEKDPEKRDATVKRLKTRKTELDQTDKDAQKEAYLDTLDKIANVAKNEEEGLDFAANLENPEDQIKAEKVATERFKRKEKDATTSRKVQAKVLEMIENKEITRPTELIEFYPDLRDSDYNTALTRLKNQGNVDAKGFVKYETAKKAFQLVNDEKFDVDSEAQATNFMYSLEYLDKEAQALGRDLTAVEANKLTRQAFIDGNVERESFTILGYDISQEGAALTLQEAVSKGVLDKWTADVNDDSVDGGVERKQIIDALRKQGIITEDETVLRLYKKEAILKLELSQKQKELLNKKINKIGVIRSIKR
jgi:hypothetical protein